MRCRLLAALAAGLAALPCQAQEAPRPKAEVLPPPAESAPAAPAAPPGCCCVEQHKTTYQLHWVERDVTTTVTTTTLREVSAPCTWPSLELKFQTTSRVHTEMVLKPCETVKEVICCTQKPVVTVDPCTGCSKITFEPVTETKLVKEVTYSAVPQEKVYMVQTGLVVPTEVPVLRKGLVLDTKTECVKRRERIGVLVPCEITERKKVCPPSCPQ